MEIPLELAHEDRRQDSAATGRGVLLCYTDENGVTLSPNGHA